MVGKETIDLKNLITPGELCELLHVKMTWIYRQVREENIPYCKIGKYLRFYRPEIEKWVAQCQVNR
jgi:excisionase family DNA binding protein